MSTGSRLLPEAVTAPGYRTPALRRLATATEWARRGLEALSVALIATYAVLVLLQVLFRYVLNQPLFWAEEVIRYGLVWSVMLGSALVAHERGHVRIDVIGAFMGRRGQQVVDLIAGGITWAFTLLLLVAGVQFVMRTLFQHSASLGVPMWTVYAAVPVGAAIEAWFMLFPRPPREGIEREGDVLL
jgi:TRAP-type C4-dicarboxylate transport system permease small subunit